MREIKFRAWDPIGRMLPWESLQNHSIHFLFVYGTLKLMQFAGLRDKNGVEIYEGDIVKGRYYQGAKSYRIIGEIVYVATSFVVRGIHQYYGLISEPDSTYEVIGNIYQNPELLKDGDTNAPTEAL